jgi:cytoskeletal protein CcmA (bactofilin family)
MAWFERNPGGKKVPELVPEKTPEAPKPVPAPAPVTATATPVIAPAEPKPAPKVEMPPQPSTAGVVGYLYKGSRVSGQLSFQGPARIDGTVDGEIQCQGTLTIGEGAEVRAKISGQVVVIRGKVEGNVTAKEKVELATPGRLIGNVDTPRLIVTEGVVFDGNCAMGVAKQKGGFVSSPSIGGDKVAAVQAPKLQADLKN